MLYPDLIDLPTEVFGGYCPAIPAADLPPGAASAAQDVIFPLGAVRTRGGLQNAFAVPALPGQPAINGLKTYLTPTLQQRLLVWDSLGNLWKENPQGTLNLINSRPYQNLLYESQTLFGREYQAFFNGLGGFDIPRQYDDTNWDRVSQVGPGSAPVAGDENITAQAIVASPNGLGVSGTGVVSSASQTGLLVALVITISGNLFADSVATDTIAHSFRAGDRWLIAGVGAGYDGTWTISSCQKTGSTQLAIAYFSTVAGLAVHGAGGTVTVPYYDVVSTIQPTSILALDSSITIAGAGVSGYNVAAPIRALNLGGNSSIFSVLIASFSLANSGGGTWTITGHIAAGLHQVSMVFVTRQGFFTPAAPPFTWTAAGNKRAVMAAIATGPPNIVARLLIFTPVIISPATTGTFYSLPNGSPQVPSSAMLIEDNATTSVTVDFTDAILISGFNAEYLFSQVELGESAFMLPYNSRTVWLGERAKQGNFLNLTFDGGFQGRVPNGWTLNADDGDGASSALADHFPVDWGDAYVITGNNASAVRGRIQQSAYQDFLGAPIIAQNSSYRVRARAKISGFAAQGTLHINLTSVSQGFTTVGLAIPPNALPSVGFVEFDGPLTDVPLAIVPSDLLLQVYVDGIPSVANWIVDSIEPYLANAPFNYSTARFSHAFNPESFDGTTGQIQVRPGDGQQLRAAFPLRNNLYLAKDHYLCYTTDDGVNEPASWAVNEVSATIGICGPNAVDWTEEWAVFAERAGLHICWGSDPVKLTPEIQSDASGTGQISWSSINWAFGFTVWVRIDKVNKRILVGAPVNGATAPNVVFMLDYSWLESAQEIAASPMVTYSTFTGKMLAHGRGRRWSIWNLAANSMTFAERIDGTAQPFFGNGQGNGKIYRQVDCALQPSDDGVAINSFWRGAGSPSAVEEQMMQLGAHRKLCGYLKGRAAGAGLLQISVATALRTTQLRSYGLTVTPTGDFGRPLNIHGERFFTQVGTNAVGSWFQAEKLILCVKKDATIVVSGLSS